MGHSATRGGHHAPRPRLRKSTVPHAQFATRSYSGRIHPRRRLPQANISSQRLATAQKRKGLRAKQLRGESLYPQPPAHAADLARSRRLAQEMHVTSCIVIKSSTAVCVYFDVTSTYWEILPHRAPHVRTPHAARTPFVLTPRPRPRARPLSAVRSHLVHDRTASATSYVFTPRACRPIGLGACAGCAARGSCKLRRGGVRFFITWIMVIV